MSHPNRHPAARPAHGLAALSTVLTAVMGLAAGAVQAQALPRSYEASPDIYQVIAHNPRYRVISVTWKPGQKDVQHAHPASAVYYLTDCQLRVYLPDGSSGDGRRRAGTAVVQEAIAAHVVENIGSADCKLVMFEPT